MSHRFLILGTNGQVGHELRRSFASAGEIICTDRSTVDLTDENSMRTAVRSISPDVILNAAACTAVDRAESEQELAFAVNAEAPRVLAEEAARGNALLVHYSTDYVFDGSKNGPWLETDPTSPLNVYGASKLAGEEAIRGVGQRHLIFRTSWVYGPHGKNFLLTMLRLGRERDKLTVVDDQIGAPTSSIAIADATRSILDGVLADRFGPSQQWTGTYHMTCAGSTSWYGFAEAIFAQSPDGPRPDVQPITSAQFPTPAKRPRNSVLSNDKLRRVFSLALPDWEQALDSALRQLTF